MASIKKIGNNYKISVTTGRNANGNPTRKCMTYHPDPTMSEALQLEEARYQARLFEEKVKSLVIDVNVKFGEYAQKCIEEKRLSGGITEKTYARYCELLRRINAEIGNVKVTDITPRHLRNLLVNLCSSVNGYTQSCYIATEAFHDAVRGKAVNRLATASGVNEKTIVRAKNGERIWQSSAEKLAKALGLVLDVAFRGDRQAKKPLAKKTIKEHFNLISGVMEYAVSEELIDRNPVKNLHNEMKNLRKQRRKKEIPLTVDELKAILAASKEEPLKWQCIIRLLMEIGDRRGAIVGIKLANIDNEKCTIHICDTVLSIDGKIYEKDSTKNENGEREVYILPATMQLIEMLIAEREQMRIANGDRWHETGYLFTQDNGRPMHPDSVNDYLAKFSLKYGFRHLHPHLFRHSLTTLLTSNGMSVAAAAKAIGDTEETVIRYYDHAPDDSPKVARDTTGRVLHEN